MGELTKGANAPLTAPRVVVTVASAVRLDTSALLLTETGRVRSDADFVFFNQTSAPGVSHRSSGSGDSVEVDAPALPPAIEKVVVTVSAEDGRASFAANPPTARVVDAESGAELVSFTADGCGAETALVLLELYQRNGAWKVRAVGQGYADGLAGIATDFGITVDDPGSASAPAAPSSSASAPVPSAPAPAATSGKVTLDKGRVSLRKRQTVSLTKGGSPLRGAVRMALGWDPAQAGRKIDLDASCIAFDARGKDLASCWFLKLKTLGGALSHSGDNLTGAGDGDDEVITVDLEKMPEKVTALVFTVNSFSGQKFTQVANAFCRLLDSSGTELVRFDLSDSQSRTGVLMCKVTRAGAGWEMTALGEYADAKTVKGLVKPAAAIL